MSLSQSKQAKKYDEVTSDVFEIKLAQLELPEAQILESETPMSQVINYFQGQGESKRARVVVIPASDSNQEKKLGGILTERDFISKGVGKLSLLIGQSDDLKILDFMSDNPTLLDSQSTVAEAIGVMALKEYRHIPVYHAEENKFFMLSERDILKFIVKFFPRDVSGWGPKREWDILEVNIQDEGFAFCPEKKSFSGSLFYYPIKKAIYREALRFNVDTPTLDVLKMMQERRFGVCVVTKYDSLIEGIFTESDFIKKILPLKWETLKNSKISQFVTKKPDTLMDKHIVSFAINNMFEFDYRRIIVVNEERFPLSVVSALDILKFINYHLFK